jgi:serine/threonine protein kinase
VWKATLRAEPPSGPVPSPGVVAPARVCPKHFAVKIFRSAPKDNVSVQRMIASEIDIHKRMLHPNIIRYFDSHETHRGMAIALEIGEGGSLYTLVRKNRKLPEHSLRLIFAQVASAISYMHRNRVANRDLKLENVLFCEVEVANAPPVYQEILAASKRSGSVVNVLKIIDFGLAADLRDGSTALIPDEHDPKVMALQLESSHHAGSPTIAAADNEIVHERMAADAASANHSPSGRRSMSEPPRGERWLSLVCGSLMYTAPEVLAGKPYQGRPVDVWSAGVRSC